MRTRPWMVVAVLGLALVTAGRAQESAEAAEVAPALVAAMKEAKTTLGQGLLASETEGKALSGKFELEGGKLQLSVYTTKGGQFFEVIIDFKRGKVLKTEPITGGDDLVAAKKQADIMGHATQSLREVVAKAEKAHPGHRALRVTPVMVHGKAHADLLLLKGAESKHVQETL